MKILVFAHQLRAGGGKFTCINLLMSILQLDDQHTYFLVVPDDPDYRDLGLEDRVEEVRYYRRRFGYLDLAIFNVITRYIYLQDFKPDLVWTMSGFGLIRPPCSQAVSVQYGHLMYENEEMEWINWFARIKLRYLRYLFRAQLPRTDLVIFQTLTMKKRCSKKYNYHGRTLVTYKGISNYLGTIRNSIPAVLKPYGNKYKLFYATRYYAHKGLDILVELMDTYREELADVVLVITIEEGQHKDARKLLAEIEEKGLQDSVINVGSLQQSQLADYYRSCDCLVMPTRLESFSGTYLEAMHYQMPILTSDLDFAREICGSAALYFDPRDVNSIIAAIQQVKDNRELRNQLITNGRRRLAEHFAITWDEIAEGILTAFEEIG